MDEDNDSRVQRVADRLSTAWNSADGTTFGQCFRDAADFVNIYAGYFVGRAAIAKQHQTIFDGVYRGSSIAFTVARTRTVADGVLLAHIRAELHVPQGPMAGTMRTLATAILFHDDTEWLIGSFHNTQERSPGPATA